jgi:signal transduction histidine kinase
VDVLVTLQWGQALVFAALGAVALVRYRRERTRASAYAATAFAALAAVTLASRALVLLDGGTGTDLLRALTTTGVVAFPWLLAAFAWSFTGPLPWWLRIAGLAVGGLAFGLVQRGPIGEDPALAREDSIAIAVILATWVVFIGLATYRLWRAAPTAGIIRSRTRLLAAGAVALGVAVVLAGTVSRAGTPGAATLVAVLTIAAGLLFATGVAPPPLLRRYWRQREAQRMHEMQTSLVAAATPEDVATAVTPILAESFGGAASCADPTGRTVAHDTVDAGLTAGPREATPRGDGTDQAFTFAVDGWRLYVVASPYTPLFDEDADALLDRFALQFRLALQRTELFAALEQGQRELERSSREMQTMLAGLAHDLRSPAISISTYASLLREARDDDDRDQMIDGITDSSAYLDRLVDGLVELSRVGRHDGAPEPVPLGGVIDAVGRRLRITHPGVTIRAPGPLPTVCADRLRVEQLLDNLLGNAAKHGGRDDLTVAVTWTPTADGGTLVIEDDGRGVPEAERQAVFDLFRRGSGARVAGSGVGLGLVRRIVESYDGTVAFTDSELGARLEVHLPSSALADGAAERPAAGTASEPAGETGTGTATETAHR